MTIESVEEFENIVKIFPEDPGVYRAYADLLAQKKSLDNAARAYGKAARLFLDLGMVLQAMVSKILEWRIVKPSHQVGRAFHRALQSTTSTETPLGRFFVGLTYPELVAFMVRLVRARFPEGKIVKKRDEQETPLFFVVSGRLRQTTYDVSFQGRQEKKGATTDLVKNDFFGDVYPLEGNITSSSDVETSTRVELVKIARTRLQEICSKYPNTEKGLKELLAFCPKPGESRPSSDERKTDRHHLPIPFKMKMFSEETDHDPLLVEGKTQDISLGGICLCLGKEAGAEPARQWVGKSVWIEIDLPQVDREIKVFGTIVWGREIWEKKESSTALGIQFSKLSGQDRKTLDDYCHDSEGEQNLMWRLWESYTAPVQED